MGLTLPQLSPSQSASDAHFFDIFWGLD